MRDLHRTLFGLQQTKTSIIVYSSSLQQYAGQAFVFSRALGLAKVQSLRFEHVYYETWGEWDVESIPPSFFIWQDFLPPEISCPPSQSKTVLMHAASSGIAPVFEEIFRAFRRSLNGKTEVGERGGVFQRVRRLVSVSPSVGLYTILSSGLDLGTKIFVVAYWPKVNLEDLRLGLCTGPRTSQGSQRTTAKRSCT